MADYDISEAFRKIELEMIASMKRNWVKHNMDEKVEGFTWSRWQAEQLRGLEEYRKANQNRFTSDFNTINESYLNQLTGQHETNFFGINKKRMDALVDSSVSDLKKAEYAMLRKTNDQYRKIIFNSQVYLNSGAGSLKKAVDMASDDFLKHGINCVVYKNGRNVNIADYAKMSLRTSTTRATLYAGGARRNELGVHTVKVSSYGMCSPTCLPWQGRVYVDNVYSGGTAAEASRLHLPLLSTAIEGGLFHPNCKHVLTTYYMDGTQNVDNGDPRNKNDRNYLKKWENSPQEIEHLSLQNQIQAQKRIAAGSLEQSKVDKAQNTVNQLQARDDQLNASEEGTINHLTFAEFSKNSKGANEIADIKKELFTNDILITKVDYPKNSILHIKNDHPERIEEKMESIISSIEHPDYIAPDWDDDHKFRANTYVFAKNMNEKIVLCVYVKIQTDIQKLGNGENNWIITFFRMKRHKFMKKYSSKNLLNK